MLRALTLSLLLAAPLAASDPPPKLVDKPVTLTTGKAVSVAVGQRCVLSVETSAKKVTWKSPAGVEVLPIDGKRLAVWAVEGTYTFTAMVPNGDDVLSVEVVLTVTGPRPPPDDKPKPKPQPPKPDPAPDGPTAAHVWVIIVEETRDRTPAQGAVIYDKGLRAWLKASGHEIDLVEQNDPAAAQYLPFTRQVGLPAVLVFDKDGKGPQAPLKSIKLPTTADALKAEINKVVTK